MKSKIVNMRRFFLLSVVTLILVSCDPIMNINYTIKNNTQQELKIKFNGVDSDSVVSVGVNESIVVRDFDKYGKTKYYDCCLCEVNLNPINGYTSDSSKILMKNYTEENNWILKKKKRKVDCVFEVNDVDME